MTGFARLIGLLSTQSLNQPAEMGLIQSMALHENAFCNSRCRNVTTNASVNKVRTASWTDERCTYSGDSQVGGSE